MQKTSTSAMSLLYECINTVIAVLISISSGMPNHTASIQLCVQKLRILIEDSDQNCKSLGFLSFDLDIEMTFHIFIYSEVPGAIGHVKNPKDTSEERSSTQGFNSGVFG